MYSFHLLLIFSVSTRSLLFLSFIMPIFGQNIPLIFPAFQKRYLVFSLLLSSSSFMHCSLKKAFLSLHAILWDSAFNWAYLSLFPCLLLLFFSHLFVKPPPTSILPCCISFSWGSFWLFPPVQCYNPLSIVLQTLCLSNLIPESICHFHCIIVRD